MINTIKSALSDVGKSQLLYAGAGVIIGILINKIKIDYDKWGERAGTVAYGIGKACSLFLRVRMGRKLEDKIEEMITGFANFVLLKVIARFLEGLRADNILLAKKVNRSAEKLIKAIEGMKWNA